MIVLARHGVTDYNAQGRFLGRTDLSLNDEGRRQVEALAQSLSAYRFSRCYSSPMRRCIESADIVAPHLERIIEPALREIDFGDWEGHDAEWIEQNYPGALELRRQDPVRFRPPNGESFEDVAIRLQRLSDALKRETGGLLIVAHRGTLSVLERLLRDLPLDSKDVVPLEPAQFYKIN